LRTNGIFPAALTAAAHELAEQLKHNHTQIVFAESCTAGLVSASLATVPGISAWLCGSAVTYQEATKISWVGVHSTDLEKYTAVSEQVAKAMAAGVLRATPHADVAVSVTGHLGPGAPPELDAVIFIGIAKRICVNDSKSLLDIDSRGELQCEPIESGGATRLILNARERSERQVEAATAVLLAAAKLVEKRK
jgi:PncC family amidohydrolase